MVEISDREWMQALRSKGNVLTCSKILVDVTGDLASGHFLDQLLFWDAHTETGWVYKTQQEWWEECRLTRRDTERARKVLKRKGILREKREGLPPKLHYQIDYSNLYECTRQFVRSYKLICTNVQNIYGIQTNTSDEYSEEKESLYPLAGDDIERGEMNQVSGKEKPKRTKRSRMYAGNERIPYSEPFQRFWAIYPRKEAKAHAWDRWQRLKLDDMANQVIEAASTHEALKREIDWVPLPATWLNQRRWEDEAPAKRSYTPIRELNHAND